MMYFKLKQAMLVLFYCRVKQRYAHQSVLNTCTFSFLHTFTSLLPCLFSYVPAEFWKWECGLCQLDSYTREALVRGDWGTPPPKTEICGGNHRRISTTLLLLYLVVGVLFGFHASVWTCPRTKALATDRLAHLPRLRIYHKIV